MNITLSGATGLIGQSIVKRLTARGDTVTVLSRSPDKAAQRLGVAAEHWDPLAGPAPVAPGVGHGLRRGVGVGPRDDGRDAAASRGRRRTL